MGGEGGPVPGFGLGGGGGGGGRGGGALCMVRHTSNGHCLFLIMQAWVNLVSLLSVQSQDSSERREITRLWKTGNRTIFIPQPYAPNVVVNWRFTESGHAP